MNFYFLVKFIFSSIFLNIIIVGILKPLSENSSIYFQCVCFYCFFKLLFSAHLNIFLGIHFDFYTVFLLTMYSNFIECRVFFTKFSKNNLSRMMLSFSIKDLLLLLSVKECGADNLCIMEV